MIKREIPVWMTEIIYIVGQLTCLTPSSNTTFRWWVSLLVSRPTIPSSLENNNAGCSQFFWWAFCIRNALKFSLIWQLCRVSALEFCFWDWKICERVVSIKHGGWVGGSKRWGNIPKNGINDKFDDNIISAGFVLKTSQELRMLSGHSLTVSQPYKLLSL